MPKTKKDEIEKLQAKRERTEARLRELKNEEKILVRKAKELERKERTHRLIRSGAMLEGFLKEPLLLSDDQVKAILYLAFQSPDAIELMVKFVREIEGRTGDEGNDGEPRE